MIKKPKKTNMKTNVKKTIFKEGDKVFDILHGWGVVSCIRKRFKINEFPICVAFDNNMACYMTNGALHRNYPPTLSFTEYTLNGFSQERPCNFEIEWYQIKPLSDFQKK